MECPTKSSQDLVSVAKLTEQAAINKEKLEKLERALVTALIVDACAFVNLSLIHI